MPHCTVAQKNIAHRAAPACLPQGGAGSRPRTARRRGWSGFFVRQALPSSFRAVRCSALVWRDALAADAPVLLMDEPFSAVDPVVRTDLQKELLRLQSRLAKTIVFVTHDVMRRS